MNHPVQNPLATEASASAEPAARIGRADDANQVQLAALRAFLASSLSAEFLAATPQLHAAFHDQFTKSTCTGERDILRYASNVLEGRKEQLAERIDDCLRQRFDAKLDCPVETLSHTGQFSLDAIALMEELGMQEDADLEQCVNQLREQCGVELAILTVHLRKLLGRNSLPESVNPAFPRVLLRALLDAFAEVGCNVRTRQAAFRTCRPLLPGIVKGIYARANAKHAGFDHRDGQPDMIAAFICAGAAQASTRRSHRPQHAV